jgi:DNA modification methylase/DNA-directed RNA polymerase subunit RPC12/RpoP
MSTFSLKQMHGIAQQKLPLDTPVTLHAKNQVALPLTRVNIENIAPEFYFSPNPYLGDFVDPLNAPKSVEEPYQLNISRGKNTYVYDAHTYHTKVPPEGIELLIEYYTRPGDVVLDAFCGSGMTGVAAIEKGRKALLCDISPAATFIAYNLATPVDTTRYMDAIQSMLEITSDLEQKLYSTRCRTCGKSVPILYMVWSYGVICSCCKQEFILWDVARDEQSTVKESKIKKEFDCPHCGKLLKKRLLKKTIRHPVLVGYQCCGRGRQEEKAVPDAYDLALLDTLEQTSAPKDLWYPTNSLPAGFNTNQPIAAGITSVDKMYTPRALWAMAHLWALASNWPDPDVRPKLLFTLTSLYQRVTVFSEFRFWGGSSNTANYNVPAIMNEQNVFRTFERKADTIARYFRTAFQGERQVRISTQSACRLAQIPDKSVDYVFTDPPFGSNINYSEMNFLWESWLGTFTDIAEEAIVNKVQGKGIEQYRQLLTQSFAEIRRVMKDGAWMTVIFHNSSDKVWQALQEAIFSAGFTIKGSQTFDKEHGTFKQFVSDNAVGYDLVLHCRKSLNQQMPVADEVKATIQNAQNFIKQAIRTSPSQYIVRYLHVTRANEVNYRRLYSEWLAHTLPNMAVRLSFEKFRELVDKVLPAKEYLNNNSLFS